MRTHRIGLAVVVTLLWTVGAHAADRTVYVDGTTSGTPGTNGAHYASLQAAITGEVGAAPDLVSGTAILHIECSVFAANAADTAAVTVNGFTADASYYVHIYAASGNRASTSWDATKYRLSVTNATAMTVRTEYTRVDGLQIENAARNGNDQNTIDTFGKGTSAEYYSNLILRHHAADSFRTAGIFAADPDITLYVWNLIDYDHPDLASIYNSSVYLEGPAAGTAYIYSSTLIGGHYGIFVGALQTATAKNTYASVNSTSGSPEAFHVEATGTLNQTTNASSDTSATGAGLDNIAVNTTNFTNVTAGSENWSLPSGSALVGAGTDTSGESAPLNFTTDINGTTRVAPWDVGAFEYVAPGGGCVVGVLLLGAGQC